jgi:hypothetical protein
MRYPAILKLWGGWVRECVPGRCSWGPISWVGIINRIMARSRPPCSVAEEQHRVQATPESQHARTRNAVSPPFISCRMQTSRRIPEAPRPDPAAASGPAVLPVGPTTNGAILLHGGLGSRREARGLLVLFGCERCGEHFAPRALGRNQARLAHVANRSNANYNQRKLLTSRSRDPGRPGAAARCVLPFRQAPAGPSSSGPQQQRAPAAAGPSSDARWPRGFGSSMELLVLGSCCAAAC